MTPDEIAAETIKALKQALDAAHGTADDVYGKYLAEREAREKAEAGQTLMRDALASNMDDNFKTERERDEAIARAEKAEAEVERLTGMLYGTTGVRGVLEEAATFQRDWSAAERRALAAEARAEKAEARLRTLERAEQIKSEARDLADEIIASAEPKP